MNVNTGLFAIFFKKKTIFSYKLFPGIFNKFGSRNILEMSYIINVAHLPTSRLINARQWSKSTYRHFSRSQQLSLIPKQRQPLNDFYMIYEPHQKLSSTCHLVYLK